VNALCERAGTEGAADLLGRDRVLVLEVALHQLVVELGDRVDQQVVVLLGELEQLCRDLADGEVLAEVVVVGDRVHLDEIDDAAVMLLLADRDLKQRPRSRRGGRASSGRR
jgi:hypothetical protein